MVKTRFVLVLLRVLKFFGIALAVIFILFGILSWVVVQKKNDWVLNQIQSYLKESQSGQLEITAINFKLFRSFPDISLELNGIDYYEHRDSLRSPREQPILHVDQLLLPLNFYP